MSNIKVKFLNKEYSIPEDVLTYIDLLNFTNDVQNQLMTAFLRLNSKSESGGIDDEDMSADIQKQVNRFIAKLCDCGIYDRTCNDYLRNNKGYEAFSSVNKAFLNKMKELLMRKLDDFQAGFEDAVYKKEASVTGMGFSIWSGSFVNHAIYAAMQASTINDQEKAAAREYQKDMDALSSRIDSAFDRDSSNYIKNVYIPNMEIALTALAYELLDRYISDLIKNGKFNAKTMNYVDITRSNDLLENLNISSNKEAVFENAFVACPYNIAVYMQAMKYDMLDYESFQTAKIFKQSDKILSFLRENLDTSSDPKKHMIDFRIARLLSLYTNVPLREITLYMADFVVNDGYGGAITTLTNKNLCRTIIQNAGAEEILRGDRISKEKADWAVDPIAPPDLWNKLTLQYGHEDLLARIIALLPNEVNVSSKEEIDAYLKEELYKVFEEARQSLEIEILKKHDEEVKKKEAEAEKARITAEKRKKFIKYGVIIGVIALIVILGISLITSHYSTISKIDNFISTQQYEHAFDAVNNSNLSNKKKQEYRNELIPLMQENIVKDLEDDQIINIDNYSVYLENNEIIVRNENGEGVVFHKGGNRTILNEVLLYANGYILFVEASDYLGYSVYYMSIDNGESTHIDTFNDFDRLIKLEDGRIFIDSLNDDDMYVIFDPYALSVKTVADFSAIKKNTGIVYDTNTYGYSLGSEEQNPSVDFSNCNVGDIIQFGRYEQDGRTANGKEAIDWIVLDVKDGKAFVVTKYAIAARSYNRGDKYSQDVSWNKCSLREWLNDDFLASAFNQAEGDLISITEASDKVFLLNIDMANQYFSSDNDRQCQVTTYAKENGASEIDNNCWWWLQSAEGEAVVVGYKGDICDFGNYIHIGEDEHSVRPAMWIIISE